MTGLTRRQVWDNLYDAWVVSGLPKSIFYETRLRDLWPASEALPSLKTLYNQFSLVVHRRQLDGTPVPAAECGNTAARETAQDYESVVANDDDAAGAANSSNACNLITIAPNAQIAEVSAEMLEAVMRSTSVRPRAHRKQQVVRIQIGNSVSIEVTMLHADAFAREVIQLARSLS